MRVVKPEYCRPDGCDLAPWWYNLTKKHEINARNQLAVRDDEQHIV
jgi:hypothetical protein